MKKIRCAIYTRKSSEEGLEQEFNSLHAQRESCASYVASQKHEGWVLLPDAYDDGGLSGGSLERPALQQLLRDVGEGRVDQIVVYKIDRLTRSLADFSKIVDVLDAADASFVSVTQSFNTATSMGRLTLNMLLSFAQFEREVTAERIRDKIAASKRKGLWVGGQVPMGYDPEGRTLKINAAEAETIRRLYDLYEQRGTVRDVKEVAAHIGLRTRRRETVTGKVSGGGPFDRGHIHHILTNPIYAGRIRHKDKTFDGQHPELINPERWDAIQLQLKDGAARTRGQKQAGRVSLLCGKLFDETGDRLTPSHTKTSRGIRLRYYISHRLIARSGEANLDGWRLPADDLEKKTAALVRSILSAPSFPGQIAGNATADQIRRVQTRLTELWETEPIETVLALVERVTLTRGDIQIRLDPGLLGVRLDIDLAAIDQELLSRSFLFQLRKRGVETKLILGTCPTGIDERLISNIARAHLWYGQIRSGQTFVKIAEAETTSKRRIQQMVDVRLIPPQYVKPYVKRNKTDAADAEAICEAVGRPNMRFVPIKTRESQGLLTLHRVRSLLVRQRTATVNAARGLLSEFGIVAAKGIRRVDDLRLDMERTSESVLPKEARMALDGLFGHLDALTAKLAAVDQDIIAWHKTSEASQRLATAPSVGPLTATALIAAVGDASQFTSARHFAAWLGLTPRISASGTREHIGRISKGGDRYLRTLLIHGARAMVGTSFRRGVRPRPWLQALIARRPVNVAAVAVAHKTARALWAMIRREEAYRHPAVFEAAA